ncbi:ComEC/Rec2 family competence protein [Alkalihalobacillus sp. AL-G]|uniref:ComEC/Rec2 family competence protein n=1 Tax=Alkalihalobacillus sp. AL-G TaxID=2926399 RepID=UPI00272A747D|nr:ComEC/Rec2 family competence protein [Alkalihalobacillus sp. AL-G]WLD94017.1 MBL fold metallo-hydrolase [Alkalihalobacillus sp. AL-G]
MTIVMLFLFSPQPAEALWKTNMELHFLDVGQADAIYLETSNGKNVLIDSGDEHDGEKVVSYLQNRGVEHLDLVIATHPHHDHIGSMDRILESFDVDSFYMPTVTYHTSYYKRLINSIDRNGIVIHEAKAGVKVKLARNIKIEFLAPSKKRYKSLNDYSAVIRIQHNKNSFLLMADAGVVSERQLLKRLGDDPVDLIKVAHHGANTGTTKELLRRTKPKHAVISVGRKNKYGYPSKEVLNRLKKNDVQVFRTDKLGTIIIKSDGKTLKVLTELPQS